MKGFINEVKDVFTLRVVVSLTLLIVVVDLYNYDVIITKTSSWFSGFLILLTYVAIVAVSLLFAAEKFSKRSYKKRIKKEKTHWAVRLALFVFMLFVSYEFTRLFHCAHNACNYNNLAFCVDIVVAVVTAELIIFGLKGTGVHSKIKNKFNKAMAL
jgi:uncharacterized membrane protein YbhN (UPF0104 family)